MIGFSVLGEEKKKMKRNLKRLLKYCSLLSFTRVSDTKNYIFTSIFVVVKLFNFITS